MAKVVVALLVTIAAVTLSGCGTFGELCCMHGRFYGGVQNDVEWLKESSPAAQGPRGVAVAVVSLVDMPVSAVADTILLPLVVIDKWKQQQEADERLAEQQSKMGDM